LVVEPVPEWGYFCQISDSTTSFGSYSGAVPNEKITWGKLRANTPRYIIESDATIVAPLILAKVLGWQYRGGPSKQAPRRIPNRRSLVVTSNMATPDPLILAARRLRHAVAELRPA